MGRAISWLDRRLNIPVEGFENSRRRGILALALAVAGAAAIGLVLDRHPLAGCRSAGRSKRSSSRSSSRRRASSTTSRRWSARSVAGGIDAGRRAVSEIVGRDVSILDEPGVARAAIESAAENFSDGVVAPAFWYLLLGLPGLLVYKLVNTANSMIGNRSPRYIAFGWAAARFDDLLNFVPARLSALLIAATAALIGFDARSAVDDRAARRAKAQIAERRMAGSRARRRARPGARRAAPLRRGGGRRRLAQSRRAHHGNAGRHRRRDPPDRRRLGAPRRAFGACRHYRPLDRAIARIFSRSRCCARCAARPSSVASTPGLVASCPTARRAFRERRGESRRWRRGRAHRCRRRARPPISRRPAARRSEETAVRNPAPRSVRGEFHSRRPARRFRHDGRSTGRVALSPPRTVSTASSPSPATVPGRPSTPSGIGDRPPEHLKAAAEAEHAAAAAAVRGDVDVPARLAQRLEIGDRRLRAGDEDQVAIRLESLGPARRSAHPRRARRGADRGRRNWRCAAAAAPRS